MDNNYFYLKNHNGKITGEKISLYQIKQLALFASTFNALPEVSEAAGKAAALYEYFQDNPEHEQAENYIKLQASEKGNEILCLSIEICLLENILKLKGFTPELSEKYDNIMKAYNTCLEINQMDVEENKPRNK